MFAKFVAWLNSTADDNDEPPRAVPVPAWDPDNWREGVGAKPWNHCDHACGVCNAELSWDEYMLDACHTCGTHFSNENYWKYRELKASLSWRKIWNGTKWVYQIKTKQGSVVRDTRLKEPKQVT